MSHRKTLYIYRFLNCVCSGPPVLERPHPSLVSAQSTCAVSLPAPGRVTCTCSQSAWLLVSLTLWLVSCFLPLGERLVGGVHLPPGPRATDGKQQLLCYGESLGWAGCLGRRPCSALVTSSGLQTAQGLDHRTCAPVSSYPRLWVRRALAQACIPHQRPKCVSFYVCIGAQGHHTRM